MFTGIVTDIGEITSVTPGGNSGDRRFVVRTRHDMAPIAIGASIACSGCCLTVVEKGDDWFAVEVSGESLDKTHLGDWKLGSRINLELSLKLGDELGGHLVYGHVDGVGTIVSMTPEGGSMRFGVNIIPHTQAVTTLGQARPGQRVNLEVDMLARYVQRLLEHGRS